LKYHVNIPKKDLKTSAKKKRKFGKICEVMEGFCFAVSITKVPMGLILERMMMMTMD
jgi:hypothetical protein